MDAPTLRYILERAGYRTPPWNTYPLEVRNRSLVGVSWHYAWVSWEGDRLSCFNPAAQEELSAVVAQALLLEEA